MKHRAIFRGLESFWLCFCCALLLPALGHATTSVHLVTTGNGLGGKNTNLQDVQSGVNAPVQNTCSTNATGSQFGAWTDAGGTASGRAEVGSLELSTFGTATAQASFASAAGGADGTGLTHASWTDTFTINSDPQYFGQLGEMTVSIYIQGNLLLACDYFQSSVYLRVNVSINDSYGANTTFAGGTQIKVALDGTVQTVPMDGALVGPGLWQKTFQFHFGRAANVTVWAEVLADAKTAASVVSEGIKHGEATSDFSHSVIWAGASNVRLGGGGALVTATSSSASGYDYLAGTIPAQPRITSIRVLPQGLALEWTDLGPRSYTVETRGSSVSGVWTPVAGVAWPIHVNTVILPLPPQSPAFFRVRVQ